MGEQTFLKVRKSQNRELLDSWRCRKSANFLGVTVRKLLKYDSPQIANLQIFITNPQIKKPQISKFLHTAQLCLKTVRKVVFLHNFSLCTNLNWDIICYISNEKKARKSYLSPQISGFAICGIYLRTVQRWNSFM